MRTIYAEYNINHDSIDVYTSAGYMLRIDCWEAEKNLKTTYGSECALTSLAVDERGFIISGVVSLTTGNSLQHYLTSCLIKF